MFSKISQLLGIDVGLCSHQVNRREDDMATGGTGATNALDGGSEQGK